MAQIVKATEAVRSFSDIINRVYYKGESFDIQKGNNIVAQIIPVENKSSVKVKNLDELLKNGPRLDPEEAEQIIKAMYEARQNYNFKSDDKYTIPTGTLKEFLQHAPILDADDIDDYIKDVNEIRKSTKQNIKKLAEKWD